MRTLTLPSPCPEATREVGAILGKHALAGDLLLLMGELGSGKTTLVQGLCQGLGVPEPARSPTFVLVHRYQGRLPVYHVDLYRIGSVPEAVDLGLEDFVGQDGVTVVEWAERALPAFPQDYLLVRFTWEGETLRLLHLSGEGTRGEAWLARAYPDLLACARTWSSSP
ncbi:MAG: tRNA (adenosine(37)-N6)-threonylcarbamoyltransferase complex ATPase subunit type 1 TsaE [Dehalococcoidia bacterium]|nr:tRNA (adenosine(37)-N6)-threonylcarbamoyltransferase complex ATPase subunit type 1 TsaE [Dehalococcoidia bacterium]MDW8119757.1 tRNA (adenosine(37)-N6)-threonylcarbamoyltransferase complex ATPase subunit type 1 TsaE [Chloroflexota bacterium]